MNFSYFNLDDSTATLAVGVDGRYFNAFYPKVQLYDWIHVCFGVNTMTGQTRVVFNDEEIVDDNLTNQFRNTSSRLPGSWAGRLVIGKWYYQDRWLQSLGAVSNINIFSRLLTRGEMLTITNRSLYRTCNALKNCDLNDKKYYILGRAIACKSLIPCAHFVTVIHLGLSCA